MRLSKSCCMFMAVIVVLTGCANPVLDDPKDETEISNEIILSNNTLPEETYSIEIITYHYKNINVEYPEIQGLKNKEREKDINQLIRNRILSEIIRTEDTVHLNELNMELECRITLQSEEFLSFYLVGESFIDGFKPFDDFYSMTLDIINATELKLSDFIIIDESLVKRLKKSTDVTNRSVEGGMDKKYLLFEIHRKNKEWMFEAYAKGLYGFVLEPNAIVIQIGVTYASGVYALIKLPGRIVDNQFIFDEPVKETKLYHKAICLN